MAEFAIMPIEDYSEACDKLRELDGSTGVIKSGDFSQKLQAIIDESAAQSIMLDQIEAALEGKAAGSGDAEICLSRLSARFPIRSDVLEKISH